MHLFIRCELIRDLLFEQNLECVLRDLVTGNADLQSRNQDLQSRNQDLQSRLHRERTEDQQQLREKVSAKNSFLLVHEEFMLYVNS